MKVLDFLELDSVTIDLKSQTKQDAISELAQLLHANNRIPDAAAVTISLLEREKLGSTGIGQGIAIPHAKSPSVDRVVAALGISRKGIDFDALDGEPVYLVFLLIAPPDSSGLHLKVLARISRLLKDKFFRQALREAKSSDEIQKIIREEDEF